MFVEAQVIMIKCIIIIASSSSECCSFSVVLLSTPHWWQYCTCLCLKDVCMHLVGRADKPLHPWHGSICRMYIPPCQMKWGLLGWLLHNLHPKEDLFRAKIMQQHAGQNVGKVFRPFLAGIKEPFTIPC